MVDIIDHDDLTSYPSLREKNLQPEDTFLVLTLANGLVSDVIGDGVAITTKIIAVTLEVAARPLRNPNGFASESIDDYRYNLPTAARRAGVYLTDEEIADLRTATATAVPGMYVMDLGTPYPW